MTRDPYERTLEMDGNGRVKMETISGALLVTAAAAADATRDAPEVRERIGSRLREACHARGGDPEAVDTIVSWLACFEEA